LEGSLLGQEARPFTRTASATFRKADRGTQVEKGLVSEASKKGIHKRKGGRVLRLRYWHVGGTRTFGGALIESSEFNQGKKDLTREGGELLMIWDSLAPRSIENS